MSTEQKTTAKVYDLKERTAGFGKDVIAFCRSVKLDAIVDPLVRQVIRSATSIGANYCEASNASSKKDFRNKMIIAKKEAQETRHWMQMLAVACPDKKVEIERLSQESHELLLIFQKSVCSIEKKLES